MILAYSLPSPPLDIHELLSDLASRHTTSASTLNSLKVFWDLDSSVQRILTLLPESARLDISQHNRTVWGGYRLYYIPGKQFSITRDHRDVDFFDLSQYFPGEPEPPTLAGVQEKADLLWEVIGELGMSSTSTLASPVAIAKSSGLLDRVDIPTIWTAQDEHLDAFEFALKAGAREWVSNYQAGEWESGLHSYDLSSAYPFEASQLIDLRDRDIVHSDSLSALAEYGFLYGDLYIDPQSKYAYCSPVLTFLSDGQLTNAVGHLPTDYYSLDLIQHIYHYNMGTFDCRSAWYIYPRDGVAPRYPFKDLMSDLFSQRTESELRSYFVKRVMTGLVGKMLETRKDKDGGVRYGELYNPIYHSIILARTACRVSEFIIKNGITQSELVHVGVDGVKATKYLPDIPTTAGMGQWRSSGSQPTIILSPAGVWTPERSPQNVPLGILQALFGSRPSSSRYNFDGWELDLRTLQARQNRRFVKLPKTGGQLLGKQYQSKLVEL